MLLITAVAFAAPTVRGTHVTEGSLADRLSASPADVVLLYAGEQRGSQADCGCPQDPRGSLARLEAYAGAVEAQGVPTFLLNAGNWLNDPVGSGNVLRSDALVQNAHMVEAMRAGSWDVLNAGFRDLPYLGVSDGWPDGVVSANGRGDERLPSHVVLQAGDIRIAVTGVTHWAKDYLQPEEVERLPAVDALESLLPTLRAEADLVVVLAYGLGKEIRSVAELDIDVLIEADEVRARLDPAALGDTLWVRSSDQTQYLGELRLTVVDGEIVRALDRAVDLDGDLPSPRSWRKREKRAFRDVKRAQETLFGP